MSTGDPTNAGGDDQLEQPEVLPADPVVSGGGPGIPDLGGLDLGAMMQMAADVQTQMAEAQEVLAGSRLEGSAGGGLVTVTLNGHLHLVGVSIHPDAFDPEDPTVLEDLIQAAWQAAHDQVAHLQASTDPLGGMGGLLGGGG